MLTHNEIILLPLHMTEKMFRSHLDKLMHVDSLRLPLEIKKINEDNGVVVKLLLSNIEVVKLSLENN